VHPYGSRKRDVLCAVADTLAIEFAESVVFANHHSDIPHMELFGHSIAVNPTARLRAIAKRRGWDVRRWE
jgi:phosphoserine phosphatase